MYRGYQLADDNYNCCCEFIVAKQSNGFEVLLIHHTIKRTHFIQPKQLY